MNPEDFDKLLAEISKAFLHVESAIDQVEEVLSKQNGRLKVFPEKIQQITRLVQAIIPALGDIEKDLTFDTNGWLRFRYYAYKYCLLNKFRDWNHYGVVVDHDYNNAQARADAAGVCTPENKCLWEGEGDAAWRTGFAALAMVLEGDEARALSFFDSLEHCWLFERPVRHPNIQNMTHYPNNLYSRDQFFPQMAACFYAWKLGTPKVRSRGYELFGKFLDVLKHPVTTWRFNTGPDAFLLPPSQIMLREVAHKMGFSLQIPILLDVVDDIWEKMWSDEAKKEAFKNLGDLENKISDKIRKWEIGPVTIVVPKKIRHEVAKFLNKRIRELVTFGFTIGHFIRPNAYWIELEHSIAEFLDGLNWEWLPLGVAISKAIGKILKLLKDFILDDMLPGWLIDDFLAWFFALYVRTKALTIDSSSDNLLDPYAVHLLFWEILMMYECRPQTWYLKDYTRSVAEKVIHHNWLPYKWILYPSNDDEIKESLAGWPRDWSKISFMWIKSKGNQMKSIQEWDVEYFRYYTRLDFMVMFKVLSLDVPR
jgi:hypothetical protein